MDLTVAAIGSLCVALCAMPFVISTKNRKKSEKQFLLYLKDLANQHECVIKQHEILGRYAIAIDDSKNYVFFVLKTKDVFEHYSVNLKDISTCTIADITRMTANGNKVIERLNLNLSPANKNAPNIVLEFYNGDVNYQLNGEFQSLEKWNNIINKLLKIQK